MEGKGFAAIGRILGNRSVTRQCVSDRASALPLESFAECALLQARMFLRSSPLIPLCALILSLIPEAKSGTLVVNPPLGGGSSVGGALGGSSGSDAGDASGGNDIQLTVVPPPPPPPTILSPEPARLLTGTHYGAAANGEVLFRFTITPTGRYTLYGQIGGRTVRRTGIAGTKLVQFADATGNLIDVSLRLESEPSLIRPILALKSDDGGLRFVQVFNRHHMGQLRSDRIHVLLRSAATASPGERPLSADGFAVLSKQTAGLINLVGRDPEGTPWSGWTFVGDDHRIPIGTRSIKGTLLLSAEQTVAGQLNFDPGTGESRALTCEGSPFLPPARGLNVFSDLNTELEIVRVDESSGVVSASCNQRNSIRSSSLNGGAKLQGNAKTGVLSGTIRFDRTEPLFRVSGLFIPHLRIFSGISRGGGFQVRDVSNPPGT